MTKTKANKMQIEDMTDRQISIRVNRIAREIYKLGFGGCNHMGVLVDVNTVDFYSMSWQEALRDNINSDELAVFQCYEMTSLDDVKKTVRDWLGL